MVERYMGDERLASLPPTTLQLFEPTLQERGRLVGKYQDMDRVGREMMGIKASIEGYQREAQQRIGRLAQWDTDIRGQLQYASSAHTASLVYLTMLDELQPQGVTDQQVFDFFKDCLKLNSRHHSAVTKKEFHGKKLANAPRQFFMKQRDEMFAQEVSSTQIPSWFKGDREKWLNFYYEHSLFGPYLSDKRPEIMGQQTEASDNYCLTLPSMLPDWFNEAQNAPPARDTVEREYQEDTLDFEQLNLKAVHDRAQMQYLTNSLEVKRGRGQTLIEERFGTVAEDAKGLPGLLMYMNIIQPLITSSVTSLTPEQMRILDRQISVRDRDLILNTATLVIKEYAEDPQTIFSKEMNALWLERIFKELGITGDARLTITSQFVSNLKDLFDQVEREWQIAHGQIIAEGKADKKVTYEVAPILNYLFTPEDKIFILEYAENLQDKDSVEKVIWALAEFMASGNNNPNQPNSERYRKRIDSAKGQVADGNRKWLRSNYQWLFGELKSVLFSNDSPSIQPTLTPVPEVQIVQQAERAEIVADIQVSEAEIRGLRLGSLAGWKVYYTRNPRSPEQRYWDAPFILNGGEEPEDELQRFMRDNKITCTIKPTSVLGVLEEIVTTPQEMENIRMRQSVGTEQYKKRKRDDMRILYKRMDNEKVLVFYLYHKEDMSYRKLPGQR